MTQSWTGISLTWRPQGEFHHVGFVVSSINMVAPAFAEFLAAVWDEQIIHDPLQDVRVSFLQSRRSPSDPLFELIELVGESAPVASFLKRQGGLHHICLVTDNMETELQRCRSRGAVIVREPVPAVAFDGRRIAWVYTKQRLLTEYLEISH